MSPVGLLCIFIANFYVAGFASNALHNESEEQAQKSNKWRSYNELATVAGSYIPGDMQWNRPQQSLAPCFRLDSEMHFSLGHPAAIQMILIEQCAADLHQKTIRYPDQYNIQVQQAVPEDLL